jgi:hypothetical protein
MAGCGPSPPPPPPGTHHERQSLAFCGLHAVNALVAQPGDGAGGPFTRGDLDAVARRLAVAGARDAGLPPPVFGGALFNPHASWLGLGDYDANVLIVALASRGREAAWAAPRGAPAPTVVSDPAVAGLLLNVRTPPRASWIPASLPLIGAGRHWFAWRPLADGAWWDLDSRLDAPRRIGSAADAAAEAAAIVAAGGEALVVTRRRAGDGGGGEKGGGGGGAS